MPDKMAANGPCSMKIPETEKGQKIDRSLLMGVT